MTAFNAIIPPAVLHTPAFVVPLGKAMFNAQADPANKDDLQVVEDFRKTLQLHGIGSPERTYYDTVMANALTIARGIKTKLARRDAMLREAELRKSAIENRSSQSDRFHELLKAGFELVCTGGLFYALFAFVASVPSIDRLIHGSSEGYAAMATTLGGVLIWSALRTRFDQRRSLSLARRYRWLVNRIWKMYRVTVKREYYHALNSVNIAWEQMTGARPPDAELAKQMLEALLSEGEDYDQMSGEYEPGFLKEVRDFFFGLRRKPNPEPRANPSGVRKISLG